MDTAGTIELEIPAVVTPDGQVNAAYHVDSDGNEQADIALLYEAYPIDKPVALVTVTATVDLDKVFAEREVDGEVEVED